ncbi:adenosine deaminase [Streptomyces sp. M19]
MHLPDALSGGEPPRLRATDERGWFRFQRLYDIARSCLRAPEDIQRLVREAAEEDVRDGSGWLEIQVDPTSYAPRLGGLIPALEIILDAVDRAARDTGLGIRVLVAANRMKHPLDARTLARLAVRYADRGIVGFGLSNDERRGFARDFDRAFAIAREGGLLAARTAASWPGRAACATAWTTWARAGWGTGARRRGPAAAGAARRAGVTCEVCPSSNVALGVYDKAEDVPLRVLYEAGCRWRWAPTTRCCSARGWPRSTNWRAASTGSPTRSWPSWPGSRSAARGPRGRSASGCWPTSTPGWRRPAASQAPTQAVTGRSRPSRAR